MIIIPNPRLSALAPVSTLSLCLILALFSQILLANEALVNINHAGVAELAERLPGIGPAKARAIVEYRELHGPFSSVSELIQVKGIGPITLEKIRIYIVVSSKDRLVWEHDSIAANASRGARTADEHSELVTRRAVQAVIQAARNDSVVRER